MNETLVRETDLLDDLRHALPVDSMVYELGGRRAGVIVVDIVRGFTEPGCGPLAPPAGAEPPPIRRMIETAQMLLDMHLPVLFFQDDHCPGKAEPPYPPHCERGSGQEVIHPDLAAYTRSAVVHDAQTGLTGASDAPVQVLRKDCINGWVGGQIADRNVVADFICAHHLEAIVVVGICTDICVLDAVLSMLSARNHGLLGGLRDIVVLAPGCATYDMPLEAVRAMGLPDTAAHPGPIAHHIGLWTMAMRGAVIAQDVVP